MKSQLPRLNTQRLLTLLLVIFIDTYGYFLVLPVLLQLFMNHNSTLLPHTLSTHARHQIYSLTLSLSPLAFITLSPWVGRLSDRFGRKIVIGASLVASIIGFSLPAIGINTHRLSFLLIGRFIAGRGTTIPPGAQAAITDSSTGKKRAFELGLIGFAMTLSMVLGPVSGAYLSNPHWVSWFNATTPFMTGIILTAINLVFLVFCFHETKSTPIITRQERRNTLSLITPTVAVLLLAFCCLELNWSLYYQACFLLFPSYFAQTINQISLFTSATGFWMSLGLTLGFRCLLQFFSVKAIALGMATLIALSLLLLSFHPTMHFHWMCSAPLALGVGILYPSLLQLITEQTPAEHQGWMLGIASTLLGFAWMITGLVSANIVDSSASLSVHLSLTAALICVACLIVPQRFRQTITTKATT